MAVVAKSPPATSANRQGVFREYPVVVIAAGGVGDYGNYVITVIKFGVINRVTVPYGSAETANKIYVVGINRTGMDTQTLV